MIMHVYPRKEGYLDFSKTECGLESSSVDVTVDPSAATLPSMARGLEDPAVCVECARSK